MIKQFITLFCSLLLASCLTPTPYENEFSKTRTGFEIKKISKKKFRITFHGNDETSQQRANDFVLLKAAEESLSNGYPFLTIVKKKSSAVRHSVNYDYSRDTAAPIRVVQKDGSVVYTKNYGRSFGTSTNQYSMTRPQVFTVVEFLEDNYDQDKEILIAKDIINSLTKKYSIDIK